MSTGNLEKYADVLLANMTGWEQSVINRIAKRIKQTNKLGMADIKALNNIAVVKQDMRVIIKELAEVSGLNISQIEKIYAETIGQQHLDNKALYDYRGKAFIPFAENKSLQAIVRAYAKTTSGDMLNLSKIGASNLGFLDKNGVFVPLQKFYTDALDKAVMQVSSGATDFHTAMRETILTMGGSGIRVHYPETGISRRLDSAVRQSLLWGAKQASVAYNEMLFDELGCDGYEIDYHSNPRPSHAFMQGRQFCIGKSKTINGKKYPGMDDTRSPISGKNVNESLNDYGCLHYKTPIICGISEPTYEPKELERLKRQDKQTFDIDGKKMTGYEAKQAMRRLETATREQKSIRDTARRNNEKDIVSECNRKIKAYQAKYNEISDITGIVQDPQRMSIPRAKK